jgi:hypothetical protein
MQIIKTKIMKLLGAVCLLFLTPCLLQAQSVNDQNGKFINVNADASNKVRDNSILYFYTADELDLGAVVIPINTRFSATVNLMGGRAFLKVRAIKIHDEIYTVDWRVIGRDYKEGIPIMDTDRSFEVYEDQRLTFKIFSN